MSETPTFSGQMTYWCDHCNQAIPEGDADCECRVAAAKLREEKWRKIQQQIDAAAEAERLNPPVEVRSIAPGEARGAFRAIDPLAAEYFRSRLLDMIGNMLYAAHPIVADQVRAFINSYLLHEGNVR